MSPVDRIFLEVGPLTVYYYGLIVTSALAVGLFLAEKNGVKKGFDSSFLGSLFFVCIVSGIVGARLYYAFVLNFDYFVLNPFEVFEIWNGGIAIHGAFLGGMLGSLLFYFFKKFSFLKFFDACSPALILAQAIGRFGNFFNQEAYGIESDLPWAIYIDEIESSVHPTFFYESVLNLFGFFILSYLFKKNYKDGVVFVSYLSLYGFNRMVVEPLRVDSSYLFGYKIAFLVAALSFAISVIYFAYTFAGFTKDDKIV